MRWKAGIFFVALFIFALINVNLPDVFAAEGLTPRYVSITVLVDADLLVENRNQDLQTKLNTEEVKAGIVKTVADSSKLYEKEFGIVFVLEAIKPWNFPRGQAEINADNAIRDVAQIAERETADITIGAVKKPMFKCRPAEKDEAVWQDAGCAKGEKRTGLIGYAYVLGNAAVIALDREERIFIHEVGHIFGAKHTEEASVMNDGKIGLTFDEKNKEIIMKNRTRTFDKLPLP